MMTTFIINLLTFGILFSSIISITSNNPIISIIFLITAFVNAAGYLILLGINFIGISYIVIYVGAIAVLFLFIILMINIKLTDILDTGYNFTKNLPIGLNIASLLLFIFFSVLGSSFLKVTSAQLHNFKFTPSEVFMNKEIGLTTFAKAATTASELESKGGYASNGMQVTNIEEIGSSINFLSYISDAKLLEFTQIEVLGHYLYTYASIFLIILSLILLLAMLAIIIISKKNVKNI
jgi:NADH-ubiquinone oxidoreductase chain 6